MDCSWPDPTVHGIWVAHALLQGIFVTQGFSPRLLCLLHWQEGSLPLAPLGSMDYPSQNLWSDS